MAEIENKPVVPSYVQMGDAGVSDDEAKLPHNSWMAQAKIRSQVRHNVGQNAGQAATIETGQPKWRS